MGWGPQESALQGGGLGRFWVSALDKHRRPGRLDNRHLFTRRRAWTSEAQPPAVGEAGSSWAPLLACRRPSGPHVLTWPPLCERLWPDLLFLEGRQPCGIRTPPPCCHFLSSILKGPAPNCPRGGGQAPAQEPGRRVQPLRVSL